MRQRPKGLPRKRGGTGDYKGTALISLCRGQQKSLLGSMYHFLKEIPPLTLSIPQDMEEYNYYHIHYLIDGETNTVPD
jgi:hypothetical protein